MMPSMYVLIVTISCPGSTPQVCYEKTMALRRLLSTPICPSREVYGYD
jgi:hypothetical protein